ncbi:hypothetical protein QVD17_24652 [Tagetes erecta]|uniref:GB1/RHD3-type G domain-containing protein n=1 Tax=Tagetes erecta TaxID=13708 RepID=A0AAD8KFB2_TARER|nr:hypothetical protein QVD17_24652 [Tagetes erecta]
MASRDKVAESYSTHLIEGDGTLNEDELDNFIKQVKLKECGDSYVIVSIMGPQNSGKSKLMNHLFHTNFKEMNASLGMKQTTQGIWIAKCNDIKPCTIVMDIEGTDGKERGEDDTVFEKQSALFAMVVSDIVIINMWYNDLGRENASNKPLLKNVLKVMLQLFYLRKTTLMFVIRDTTKKAPVKILEHNLRRDVQKPQAEDFEYACVLHLRTPHMYMIVEVVTLCNYEDREEEFKEQVASLRQKFVQSIAPGGLASDRRGVVPADAFSLSVKTIWKRIKENKDLQLPAHTIMVATIRCEEIAKEKYSSFVANQDWLELEEDVKSHIVPDFGKKLSSMLESCLSIYDKEVIYYDASVVSTKRKQFLEKLLQYFPISFGDAVFSVTARGCMKQSVKRFDELCKDVTIKQANWDSTNIRLQFSHDLDLHNLKVQAAKLSELTTLYESKLEEALSSHVQDLLEQCGDDTWPAIRRHLHGETEKNVYRLYYVLSSFEMREQDKEDMLSKLKHYGRKLVERKAKYEARKVLGRMKERFAYTFNHDNESKPRVAWTENEDIPAITITAMTSCLKLLSVMAKIRLDDEDRSDIIWDTLVHWLLDPQTNTAILQDPLASTTWEEVPTSLTLITPVQCKSLWDQFKSETHYIISQATASQEAHRQVTSLSGTMTSLSNQVTSLSKEVTSLSDTKDKLHQDVLAGTFGSPAALGVARCIRHPE